MTVQFTKAIDGLLASVTASNKHPVSSLLYGTSFSPFCRKRKPRPKTRIGKGLPNMGAKPGC